MISMKKTSKKSRKLKREKMKGREGGDDEINEHEHEKSDAEVDREEEFINEEKEGDEGGENITEEKDSEESNGETEKEGSLEESDHDGDEQSAHEAREEHYKADDASSAVAHDNQIVDPENENGSLENTKEQPETNILERESKENNGEETNFGDKRTDLELKDGEIAKTDNLLNVTTNEVKENLSEKPENSPFSNTTLTEGSNDHIETSNNSSEVRMESRDPSLQNGTDSKLELNYGQNGTVGGTTSGEANKSTLNVDDNHIDSNSTIPLETKDSESSSGEFSDSSNNKESSLSENIRTELSVEAGSSTESLKAKSDATETEKSDPDGGTDEFLDKTSEEVQHDPIDSSDSSNSLDEKDVRTDLETLPEMQTAGTNTEDAAAE
ncbi:Uncharacterized protein Adt_26516 [Abeliophyllum distichum]|uniref:Uncharacterized protein n=1 Tax=Abeliophyllum distichum TaxID=126358 RepID=A0ABD1RR98_9LAMI